MLIFHMWAILAIFLPLAFLLASNDIQFSPSMLLIALLIVYSSFRVSRVVAHKRKRIVALTFWLFVYVFLGVAPLVQVANQAFAWSSHYDEHIIFRAAIVSLVGALAFDIGHYLLSKRRVEGLVPSILQRRIRKGSVVAAGLFALVISAFFLAYLGDITHLFSTREARFANLADNFEKPQMLLFNALASAPLFVASLSAMALWVASRRDPGQEVGYKWRLMSLFLLLAVFMLNNPISTARYMVGTILLSLLFINRWKRSLGVAAVFFLVGGLLFIFPSADIFRTNLDSSIGERLSTTSIIKDVTSKGDFDAFQQIANAILVADAEGLQFGRQVGGAFLFWFPRSIWPTKPLATGEYIAEGVGYEFTNLSAPLWAEFYTDGGILLVIAGFALYGFIVRVTDHWGEISDRRVEVGVVTIFPAVFAGYQIFLLRGSLMPAVAYLTPMVVFVFLLSIGRKTQG